MAKGQEIANVVGELLWRGIKISIFVGLLAVGGLVIISTLSRGIENRQAVQNRALQHVEKALD